MSESRTRLTWTLSGSQCLNDIILILSCHFDYKRCPRISLIRSAYLPEHNHPIPLKHCVSYTALGRRQGDTVMMKIKPI